MIITVRWPSDGVISKKILQYVTLRTVVSFQPQNSRTNNNLVLKSNGIFTLRKKKLEHPTPETRRILSEIPKCCFGPLSIVLKKKLETLIDNSFWASEPRVLARNVSLFADVVLKNIFEI